MQVEDTCFSAKEGFLMKEEINHQHLGTSVFVNSDGMVGGCAPTYSVISKIDWSANSDPEDK